MKEILEILENNARASAEDIARMLGRTPKAVKDSIKKMEKDGLILKYKTVINKELLREEDSGVRALIEVRVVPQRKVGFEHIAERIYQFPEVTSCYLMSGTYDLLVVVEGKNLHAVSEFITEKLASLENIQGTATHFILKKYKEDRDILKQADRSKRPVVS